MTPSARFAFALIVAFLPLAITTPAAEATHPEFPPCEDQPGALCLLDGRFAVTATWKNQHAGGREGVGTPVALTNKTGVFWFFNAENYEVMIKILDGRSVNGRFWVFLGSLSDVGYEIRVLDLETGNTRTYVNPPGNRYGITDTTGFPIDHAPFCGGIAGFPCHDGLYCDQDPGTCNVADAGGRCVVRTDLCPPVFRPVCGCDGVTYGSDCDRIYHLATKDRDGPCERAEVGEFCDPPFGYLCQEELFCEAAPGACGAPAAGQCVLPPEACTLQFDPVCGCDGVTYSNDCFRQMAGVSQASVGACPVG